MAQNVPYNLGTTSSAHIPAGMDPALKMQLRADLLERMDLLPLYELEANVNYLDFVIPTLGEGFVQTDVNELEGTLIKTAKYGSIQFSIKKDVGHIAESDEAKIRFSATGIDNMRWQRNQVMQAFEKEATKRLLNGIKVNPQTHTNTGGAWGTATANPLKDLTVASSKLKFGNRKRKYIVLNPVDFAELTSNEIFMKFATAQAWNPQVPTFGGTYSVIEDTLDLVALKKAYLVAEGGAGIYATGEFKDEPYRNIDIGADAIKLTHFNGISPAIELTKAGKNAGVVEMTLQ
jgi:hypothetical protein